MTSFLSPAAEQYLKHFHLGSVSNDLMWLIPPFIEANSDNPGDGLKVTFYFKLKLLPFFCTSEL